MKNLFNSVAFLSKPRAYFDMSYDKKFSLDMGALVPFHVQEVLPADKISIRSEQMIRFAPFISPVMHRMNVKIDYFFVPNRLLWDGWEDFITGGDYNEDESEHPYFNVTDISVGSIGDYMGMPIFDATTPEKINAFPLAAMNLCWNEYFRDQNLQDELPYKLVDGDQSTNPVPFTNSYNSFPLKRAWEHDYFTSASPEPQKGPSVSLPLGTEADVEFVNGQGATKWRDPLTGNLINIGDPTGELYYDDSAQAVFLDDSTGDDPETAVDNSNNLRVNLSTATAATIRDLREAITLQEYYEALMRGGSRYFEYIKTFFGARTSDARFQRPEYLGGLKNPVLISEIPQMSSSVEDGTPQGNLAGKGISAGSNAGFTFQSEEHGFIIGFISVQPTTAYYQGLPKQFSRLDRYDYCVPIFSNVGEQPILKKELFFKPDDDAYNNGVFGYTPKYAEYRYIPSQVSGDFRDVQDYWHLGRKFSSLTPPVLNDEFIECNPDKRIFAVQDLPDTGDGSQPIRNYHTLYCHLFQKIGATRCLPQWGVPRISSS